MSISGSSQLRTVTAHPREFEGSSGKTIQYIHYRGYGTPPLSIGQPGDIFIDMSTNGHRLFIRYDEWREWSGVHRSGVEMSKRPFIHPGDNTRIMWCSSTDVLWQKKSSFYQGRLELFKQDAYLQRSFISAHELIKRSGVLSRPEVPTSQKYRAYKSRRPRTTSRPDEGIQGTYTHTPLSTPFDGFRDLQPLAQDSQTCKGSGRCTPPTRERSPAARKDIAFDSQYQPASTLGTQYSTLHHSQIEASNAAQTEALLTIRLPGKGYQVLSVHKRSFEKSLGENLVYIQYRGRGCPSLDLGSPGDFFVDKSSGAHRLFVRYNTWLEWPGIYDTAGTREDPLDKKFLHPQDPTRVVWCTTFDVTWFKNSSIRNAVSRYFALEAAGTSFISTHDLLSRCSMGIGRPKRSLPAGSQPLNNTNAKKRRVSGKKPPSEHYVSDSEPPSSTEPQTATTLHPKLHSAREISSSPDLPLSASVHPSRFRPRPKLLAHQATDDMSSSESESPESSALSTVFSIEKHTTPATSPRLRSSPASFLSSSDGATTSIHKKELMDGILPASLNEAVVEAKRTHRIKELYTKRKERYQTRRQELAQNELEIATQEEQLKEAEKRAKERLEKARQNALRRKEEIKQREEELRREKEELEAREVEVFQREQALKRRRALINQMEGMIGQWDEA